MKLTNDIIQNSGLSEAFKIVNAYNKLEAKNNRIRRENKKIALANKIYSGQQFTLILIYLEKQDSGLYYEEIELEGSKNALMIFDQYRKFGHSLKLRSLTMNVEGSKTKKVNFTY